MFVCEELFSLLYLRSVRACHSLHQAFFSAWLDCMLSSAEGDLENAGQ